MDRLAQSPPDKVVSLSPPYNLGFGLNLSSVLSWFVNCDLKIKTNLYGEKYPPQSVQFCVQVCASFCRFFSATVVCSHFPLTHAVDNSIRNLFHLFSYFLILLVF